MTVLGRKVIWTEKLSTSIYVLTKLKQDAQIVVLHSKNSSGRNEGYEMEALPQKHKNQKTHKIRKFSQVISINHVCTK